MGQSQTRTGWDKFGICAIIRIAERVYRCYMRVIEIKPPARDNENVSEWDEYLNHWQVQTHSTWQAYESSDYNKALAIARVNVRIKKKHGVRLKRNQLGGLFDLLNENQQRIAYRRTIAGEPGMVTFHNIKRPTELEAIARVVFAVINGDRDVVIEAPHGTLWCTRCAEFKPYHKFHINIDKPRGYEDQCRDCINISYKRLRAA